MIKKLKSIDVYPTSHLKYVMDSEWDILQALRPLMQKLIVTDTPTSAITWNIPSKNMTIPKKHSDAKSNTDTWTSSDLDILTSDDTEDSTSNTPPTDTQITYKRHSPTSLLPGPTNEDLLLDPRWTPPPKPTLKPSRWKLEWVASHQDNDTTINISTLPTGTQLNIKADKLATT